MSIRKVINENRQEILKTDNVTGFGRGLRISGGKVLDEEVLVVMVTEKKPKAALASSQLVPVEVQGVRTDVQQVGHLRALSNTGRVRPLRGGFSVGHYKITAGTLGAFVKNGTDGTKYILSNNHVLANCNQAEIGDQILQPGTADGGRVPDDVVANLYAFCPIDFGEEPGDCDLAKLYAVVGNLSARAAGSKHRLSTMKESQALNVIDAALARPNEDIAVSDNIIDIGIVTDVEKAYLGMNVAKSGRTTGYTSGSIRLLDAVVTVDYGGGRSATFEDQLVSGFMSQGGDSGSLLVTKEEKKAVGLLYAGSDQVTLYNPIAAVLDYFGVNF